MNTLAALAEPRTWILGVVAVLVVTSAWWVALRRGDARRRAVLGARVDAQAGRASGRARALRLTLVAFGALAAWGVATAPAQRGPGVDDEGVGADVVVALDVSRSMLAQDVESSRLERARDLVHRLIDARPDARFALVTFAGDARLASPLTNDRESAHELLDLADPDSARRGGTDFALALETALTALSSSPRDGVPATIVLVSDGEDLAGRGVDAARLCRRSGVTVSCVGLGTALGAKIPLAASGPGASARFVQDEAGVDVVTTFDARGLDAIARAGGGRFVDGNGDPDAVEAALARGAIASAVRSTRDGQDGTSAVLACALLACLMWWIESAWAERGAR